MQQSRLKPRTRNGQRKYEVSRCSESRQSILMNKIKNPEMPASESQETEWILDKFFMTESWIDDKKTFLTETMMTI